MDKNEFYTFKKMLQYDRPSVRSFGLDFLNTLHGIADNVTFQQEPIKTQILTRISV